VRGRIVTLRGKIAALLCLLFAAGCYDTQTSNPIGTTTGLVPDKALTGIWKEDSWRSESGDYLHIFRGNERDMTLLWIEAPKGDHSNYSAYRITTAKLGSNRFFNAAPERSSEQSAKAWMPVFYTLRKQNKLLTVYLADDDRVAAAIEAGEIKGVVKKHTEKGENGKAYTAYDKVEITAKPAELDAFMARPEAAELFKVVMVLKRME
jgi:hypothetical protein